MAVSVFDLFKIGIGPSSSHTVGPMRAARLFMQRLLAGGVLARTARIRCELFGSLGATGKGHGSDKAVILGLAGHDPETVDVEAIPALLQSVRSQARLRFVQGSISHEWGFTEAQDLVFNRRTALPFHANGMSLTAWAADGQELCTRRYYSVGVVLSSARNWRPTAPVTPVWHRTPRCCPTPFTAGRTSWTSQPHRACRFPS